MLTAKVTRLATQPPQHSYTRFTLAVKYVFCRILIFEFLTNFFNLGLIRYVSLSSEGPICTITDEILYSVYIFCFSGFIWIGMLVILSMISMNMEDSSEDRRGGNVVNMKRKCVVVAFVSFKSYNHEELCLTTHTDMVFISNWILIHLNLICHLIQFFKK